MPQKPDNYPQDPPPERPQFYKSVKFHVGVRPPPEPGAAPTGYVLEEVQGGKKTREGEP
jgi:hypothetical protein